MASLEKCFECGESVSSDAGRCPHCQTFFRDDLRCVVCGEHIKKAERVSVYQYEDLDGFDVRFHFHRECQAKVGKLYPIKGIYEGTCPACKTRIKHSQVVRQSGRIISSLVHRDCPRCGHPDNHLELLEEFKNYGSCTYCNYPLRLNEAVLLGKGVYSHKECYTPARRQARQDTKQKRREQEENVLREEQEKVRRARMQAQSTWTRIFVSLLLALILVTLFPVSIVSLAGIQSLTIASGVIAFPFMWAITWGLCDTH